MKLQSVQQVLIYEKPIRLSVSIQPQVIDVTKTLMLALTSESFVSIKDMYKQYLDSPKIPLGLDITFAVTEMETKERYAFHKRYKLQQQRINYDNIQALFSKYGDLFGKYCETPDHNLILPVAIRKGDPYASPFEFRFIYSSDLTCYTKNNVEEKLFEHDKNVIRILFKSHVLDNDIMNTFGPGMQAINNKLTLMVNGLLQNSTCYINDKGYTETNGVIDGALNYANPFVYNDNTFIHDHYQVQTRLKGDLFKHYLQENISRITSVSKF